MTQPLTVVILSTGLENFKELRNALTADSRVQLLAGGDDADRGVSDVPRVHRGRQRDPVAELQARRVALPAA